MPKRTPWAKPRKGLPAWVKAIPESQAHGSGTLQKRLWRVISDYVRIRDWYRFGPFCVASGKKLDHWKDGHAGHFIAYSHCRGIFKFDPRNIHLQHGYSNKYGTRESWQVFEAELIRRYGIQHINQLEDDNKATPLKFTTEQLLERLGFYLNRLGTLPEQPDYWQRAMALRDS